MYSDRQISFVSYSIQCVWLSVLFIKEKWINTIIELGQPYQETTEMLCHLQITDTVYGTDEQYVFYCIEIPYQKLGLYWYWMIFQNSAIPIPNQYQQKIQWKYNSGSSVYYSINDYSTKHCKQKHITCFLWKDHFFLQISFKRFTFGLPMIKFSTF